MSRDDWSRPRNRLRGRSTESVNGGDLSMLLRPRRPLRPQVSKSELRRQADAALDEWRRRKQAPKPSTGGPNDRSA